MYDLNMLANYLNQMYFERQLQEMNWSGVTQSSGLVQLHPMYLNAMSANHRSVSGDNSVSLLALPSVEGDQTEVQGQAETAENGKPQNFQAEPVDPSPNGRLKITNQVRFEQPRDRFVFGQPPTSIPPPLTHTATKEDEYAEDADDLSEADQAYDVLDVFDDSFDDEIEDGRYSATMFKAVRPTDRSKKTD
jgi:hypothetical protein